MHWGLLVGAAAIAALVLAGGSRPEHSVRFPNTSGVQADPCEPSKLELSEPRGRILAPSKLTLRWRTAESGPFQVKVVDEDGRELFTSETYGYEFRLLVSKGPGEMRGPHAEQLEPGHTYRWSVRPQAARDASKCPSAEFHILRPDEAQAAAARFRAEGRKLGVGNEAREPEAEIALAKLYLKEGFYTEAEAELKRLIQRGWEDKRISELLASLYRKTDRQLSLRDLSGSGEEAAGRS